MVLCWQAEPDSNGMRFAIPGLYLAVRLIGLTAESGLPRTTEKDEPQTCQSWMAR